VTPASAPATAGTDWATLIADYCRVELKRLELKIAAAKAGAAASSLPKPGECVHRNVTAIVSSADDELRGWLCRSCDQQLPPTWAVRAEDL
jgi:hypothetical protein